MKPIGKPIQADIFLIYFLSKMLCNKGMLECHLFSTLLQNMALGMSRKIRWGKNSMGHIS
jgi:hypothetical protein